jgi:RNA polymerase sigma-70 factor (sigma-E family)
MQINAPDRFLSARSSTAAAPAQAGQHADEVVRELYQAHALTLTRMARLLLRDQAAAEDAVQDAFLGLYRALPGLRDPDKLLPYLRAAVINRCRTELRGRRRAALRGIHYEPPAASAENAAMAAADRRAVLDAVGALPRRAREVLVLRYYLDLPDDQIAAALGISRGTVSSTASRAVATLARVLKEESE